MTSFISHVTKILITIIMKKNRNKIKPEIAEKLCGFIEGEGTTNASTSFQLKLNELWKLKRGILCASLTIPNHLREHVMMR